MNSINISRICILVLYFSFANGSFLENLFNRGNGNGKKQDINHKNDSYENCYNQTLKSFESLNKTRISNHEKNKDSNESGESGYHGDHKNNDIKNKKNKNKNKNKNKCSIACLNNTQNISYSPPTDCLNLNLQTSDNYTTQILSSNNSICCNLLNKCYGVCGIKKKRCDNLFENCLKCECHSLKLENPKATKSCKDASDKLADSICCSVYQTIQTNACVC